MLPKVSVNICCYNSEKFIKETIQSVLDQTYKEFEIIIIDDGSKDKTGEIVKSIKDSRVKYYYQDNMGLSASRNRALEMSKGEYVALLDHDDIWEPEKLEKQVALIDSNKNLGLVFSDSYIIDKNGKIKGTFFELNRPARGQVTKELINADFIPCLTAVMRKSYMEKVGNFKNELKIAEEYDYFLRLSLISDFDYVNAPLAKYRLHQGNASKDIIRMHMEEIVCLSEISKSVNDAAIMQNIEKRIKKTFMIIGLNIAVCSYKEKIERWNDAINVFVNIDSVFNKIGFLLLLLFPSYLNIFLKKMFKFIKILFNIKFKKQIQNL